jgi:hypothetical protein
MTHWRSGNYRPAIFPPERIRTAIHLAAVT